MCGASYESQSITSEKKKDQLQNHICCHTHIVFQHNTNLGNTKQKIYKKTTRKKEKPRKKNISMYAHIHKALDISHSIIQQLHSNFYHSIKMCGKMHT